MLPIQSKDSTQGVSIVLDFRATGLRAKLAEKLLEAAFRVGNLQGGMVVPDYMLEQSGTDDLTTFREGLSEK